MSLVDILNRQSVWTYDIMSSSKNLGEMIREDAITSINLIEINNSVIAQNIPLSTTSIQGGKLEAEIGADWIWSFKDSIRLIQAKRLDFIGKYPGYTIETNQLSKLLQSPDAGYFGAKQSLPVYVFYSSDLPGNKYDVGCTFIEANVLAQYIIGKGKQDQENVKISPQQLNDLGASPWRYIFG